MNTVSTSTPPTPGWYTSAPRTSGGLSFSPFSSDNPLNASEGMYYICAGMYYMSSGLKEGRIGEKRRFPCLSEAR